MTNLEAAEKEWKEVKEWAIQEEMKVSERLKAEGRLMGFDVNNKDFQYIEEFTKRRLKEIQEKYRDDK